MEIVLNREASELGEQFCDFSRWNYYTGFRHPIDKAVSIYPDASSYPLVRMAVTDTKTIGDKGIAGAFPNPFDPVMDGVLRFPLDADVVANTADLYIFSPSMNLVRKQTGLDIRRNETYGVHLAWDGRTLSGGFAPSGIYFYTINYGSELRTGKFAVVLK